MSLLSLESRGEIIFPNGDRAPPRNIPDFCIAYIRNLQTQVQIEIEAEQAFDKALEGRVKAFLENDHDLQEVVGQYLVQAVSKLAIQYMGHDHDRMYLFKSAGLILSYPIPRKDKDNPIGTGEMRRLLPLHALSPYDFTGYKPMTLGALVVFAAQPEVELESTEMTHIVSIMTQPITDVDKQKDLMRFCRTRYRAILDIVQEYVLHDSSSYLEIIPMILSSLEKFDLCDYYEASKQPCNPIVLKKMIKNLPQEEIDELCEKAGVLTGVYKEEEHPIHIVYSTLKNFSSSSPLSL